MLQFRKVRGEDAYVVVSMGDTRDFRMVARKPYGGGKIAECAVVVSAAGTEYCPVSAVIFSVVHRHPPVPLCDERRSSPNDGSGGRRASQSVCFLEGLRSFLAFIVVMANIFLLSQHFQKEAVRPSSSTPILVRTGRTASSGSLPAELCLMAYQSRLRESFGSQNFSHCHTSREHVTCLLRSNHENWLFC